MSEHCSLSKRTTEVRRTSNTSVNKRILGKGRFSTLYSYNTLTKYCLRSYAALVLLNKPFSRVYKRS